ncbi:MAG: hypothetical protein HYU64_01695 [Armatimonadetes bacterium]|nr:hypothetical protein [Armatimonadota bacterium]
MSTISPYAFPSIAAQNAPTNNLQNGQPSVDEFSSAMESLGRGLMSYADVEILTLAGTAAAPRAGIAALGAARGAFGIAEFLAPEGSMFSSPRQQTKGVGDMVAGAGLLAAAAGIGAPALLVAAAGDLIALYGNALEVFGK